jgi:hypothetical protein
MKAGHGVPVFGGFEALERSRVYHRDMGGGAVVQEGWFMKEDPPVMSEKAAKSTFTFLFLSR